ncbi:MMPL family transporter [Niallia sp. XMNu-256]|uniref:MMPL family transporter n=1 Tax=Niallia sp. XMNu-256 TaxID=3082444 RepID=UPI0030CAEA3C
MFKLKKTIAMIWIILTVIMGYFAFQLPSILTGSGFEMEGSYAETQKILEEEFDQSANSIILLFEKDQDASASDFESFIDKTIHKNVVINRNDPSPAVFKGNYAYVTIQSDDQTDLNELKAALPNHKGFSVSLTGGSIIEDEMSKKSQEDLANAEMIGLPIAMIILLLAFGGLVAASIPLLIGVVAVVITMGVVYFLGHSINLSIFVLNVVPMIGLALSIDFALLYINRFREELSHHSVEQAIKITNRTAGRSIGFSGLCVALGLSGMLVFQVDIFKSVAIGGIAVVVVSVLSALTFLPAILSILGHRINKAMILKRKDNDQSWWRNFATFVMKRPLVMSLATLAILTMAILPVKDMELEIPDASALPATSEARIAYEKFEETFVPSDQSTVTFIVETEDSLLAENSLSSVESFISKLEKEKLVDKIDSIFTASGDVTSQQFYAMLQNPQIKSGLEPVLDTLTTEDKTILYVTINAPASSEDAKDWVREIESTDMPLNFTMGGYPKFNQEIFDEVYDKIPLGLSIILGSTFIILLVAFQSILIPLKAILMNMFSLGAAFGIVVWIFQEGHFGIDPSLIGLMIPIIAFAVVFGLSMDYEVFLISRIHEEYLRTRDNNFATLEGLTITSKVITAAAAIMIVVTGAFAFTEIVPVKQIGIAVALSIFIDATLVRMILVPSLMKLLGDWNWWLPFRKRKRVEKNPGQ